MSSGPVMGLRADQRLRRNADFRVTREQGRRTDCGAFLLTWRSRGDAQVKLPRVGVVASRASVGDAVRRNRAKRRLRELFRRHQHDVPPGIDLILTARSSIDRLAFAELEKRFAFACKKLTPP